jgi:hypothetical protein
MNKETTSTAPDTARIPVRGQQYTLQDERAGEVARYAKPLTTRRAPGRHSVTVRGRTGRISLAGNLPIRFSPAARVQVT